MAPHLSTPVPSSAPTGRPARPEDVSARVRRVRTVLAVLTAVIGALAGARLLLAPGAGIGFAPQTLPQGPTDGAQASLVAAAGILVAVHVGLAVGVARYSEAARLIGAFVVGGVTLSTLLTTVRMFAFPPAQWPVLVALAGLLAAAAIGWFVCAFHRPFGDACKGISRARAGRGAR